ncbi:MAG TPA: disulfide bond formation protein B [Patescibacteria group bacterium]|nr:disulfide bond formation protein B [Patescibacteria group bacterium]
MVSYINQLFGALTIVAQVGWLAVLLIWIFRRDHKIISFFQKNALLFSFLIVLGATLASLYYSEVVGYPPCNLCWYQRVFLYPQLILTGLALYHKDQNIFKYLLPLSVIGGIVAVYQYLLQLGLVSGAICGVSGGSCTQVYISNFGYVTMVMMSFTAFLLLASLAFVGRKKV